MTRLCNKTSSSLQNQRRGSDRYSAASSDGDSSDNDSDKRLSGPPMSPPTPGLGRISETTEEEGIIEEEIVEDSLSQPPVVSPSQA